MNDGLLLPLILSLAVFDAVHVSSRGTLAFGRRLIPSAFSALPDGTDRTFLAPFQAVLGFAPASRWPQLSAATNSLFWHDTTASGSRRFTWVNALLDRHMRHADAYDKNRNDPEGSPYPVAKGCRTRPPRLKRPVPVELVGLVSYTVH